MSSPKAKVTRSNRVGCANFLNHLARLRLEAGRSLSAECPRNLFASRSAFEPATV